VTARTGLDLRVGFIGLGRMGGPMAKRLIAGGAAVTLFDQRPEAVERVVAEAGGGRAASPGAVAAGSDVVITMLPDGRAVRAVVLGADGGESGILAALPAGAVLIDMSSSAPTGTQALGRVLAERGIAMLDAPVSGGVARAQSGTLAVMVGGDPAVVTRCRPLLALIGHQIFETGPLGSGHALKALNNLVSAAGLVAAAEALLIGRRFGLDPQRMIDVFNASSARNNSTENKFAQHVFSRSFASGFALDLMVKDLGIALDLARDTDTPAPLSAACRSLWASAQGALDAGADHTAIVQWMEMVAGTRLGTGTTDEHR